MTRRAPAPTTPSDGALARPVDDEAPAQGLRIRGLAKTFPGTVALKGIDLDIAGGSVHALLGHNGCGKSTFVKVLAGYHEPDAGARAWIDGVAFPLGSADEAQSHGVRIVHQDLGLVEELSALDNVGLALGYARGSGRLVDWRQQAKTTRELLERFDVAIDPTLPLLAATPVERTAVAIVRAVAGATPGRGLLVLDEPTAALPAREVESLFRLIRTIRDSGTAVLLVSHRLDEVMAIADHATVMRAGEVIWDGGTSDMSVERFATLIAGEEVQAVAAAVHRTAAATLDAAPAALEVKGLHGRYLAGVSFTLHRGEVLGCAGLLGSGREELPYVVAGATDTLVAGDVTAAGLPVDLSSVTHARAHGIVLVPADRTRQGVVADFTVRENVSLAALSDIAPRGWLSPEAEREFARSWLARVRAAPGVEEKPISALSGGNQQKAVLARWLSVGPTVLVVSEPTAGLDAGARATIYEELRKHAREEGLAVLMCSSDVEDLVAACDRVLVLRAGEVAADLSGDTLSKQAVVAVMEGVRHEQT